VTAATDRLVTATLCLLVIVGLFAETGHRLFVPENRPRRWLQPLVAQQLADTLGRQVQLGRIEGDLITQVVAHQVAVAEGERLSDGAVLSARRLELHYDLRQVLRSEIAPAASISLVRVEGARARLIRDETGVFNFSRLLPKGPPAPPEKSFRGKVEVADSEISYQDRSVRAVNGRPLNVRLRVAEAEVDLGRTGWIEASLSGWERSGKAGYLSASSEMNTRTGFVWIDADVSGMNAPWWYNFFAANQEVRLRKGVAEVSGTVAVVPRKGGRKDVTLTCDATVRDGRAQIKALKGMFVDFEGEATATPDGVQVHRLMAHSGGTCVRAEGSIADFGDPVLDLCFQGEVARPAELARLVPNLQDTLADAEVNSSLQVTGQLVGSPSWGNLSLTASLPGTVSYANSDLGRAEVEDLTVQAQVLDLSDPTVRVDAQAAQVRASDLSVVQEMIAEQVPGPLEVAPLDDVQVAVLWAGDNPVVHADLKIPRITAGDLAIEDVSARAAMAGMVLSLDDIYARALGSTVNGEAVVDLRDLEDPWACFSAKVAGSDLARLGSIPGAAKLAEVTGAFNGQVAGEYGNGETTALGEVGLSHVTYDKHSVETVRALVEVDGDGLDVLGGRILDNAAQVWFRGKMPWDGDMALRFGAAGLDLAELLKGFEVSDVKGQVYVSGAATGTFEAPEVQLAVQGFNVSYKDYEADAVVAEAHGNPDALHLDSLYASSGKVVVSAQGVLTEIDLDDRDATVNATAQVAGPIDEQMLALAGQPELDLEGAVRLEAEVGGTLKQPFADGHLYLDYGRYETIATDASQMDLHLASDMLRIDNIRMAVGEAIVSGNARIESLWEEPTLAAQLSAHNVVLQNLAFWQDVGLPLSGRVDLPHLDVMGPLDDLHGQAQIEASDLALGEEDIGRLSAWVQLDDEVLTLRRTEIAIGGGRLSLEGRYNLPGQEILASGVKLDQVAIPHLLGVAEPIAETFVKPAGEEMPLDQRLASLGMRTEGVVSGSFSLSGKLTRPEEGQAPAVPANAGDELDEKVQDLLANLIGEVQLDVKSASFDGKSLPDMSASAQIAGRKLTGIDFSATEGEALITAAGEWDLAGDVDLLLETYSLDLAAQRDWLPESVGSVEGQLSLTVQATGPQAAPNLIASVDITDARVHGARFDLISAPVIRIDGKAIDVDSLELRRGDEQIFIDGELPFSWKPPGVPPDGPLHLTGRTENAQLGFFPQMVADLLGEGREGLSFLSDLQADGTVNSQVAVTGTPAHPQLIGWLKVADGQIMLPASKHPIKEIAVDARFSRLGGETLFELKKMHARADATSLDVYGRAQLGDFTLAGLHRNEYDFTAKVSSPLQKFGGGLALADVGGEIQLHTVDRGRQLLTVDNLGGTMGGGGVYFNGSVALESFLPERMAENDFNLALRVDGAKPKYSHLFRGTVNGEILAQTPKPNEPAAISGRLDVSHAAIGLTRPAGGTETELRGMPEGFPAPSFNVAVVIGQDVRVTGGGMTAPLKPTEKALLLSGTPQRPVVRGLIELQEGQASVPTGVLDIEQAGVQYMIRPELGRQKPPVKLEVSGRVWGTASRVIPSGLVNGREVGPVEVKLEVGGTLPANILVTATSRPPMAEEQIYALLGTQPFLAGLGTGRNLTDVMSKQFMSALGLAFRHYLFQPFEEELKEMLGLSTLEVSFAVDQSVELKVGRYLVKDLLVTYERPLGGPEEKFDLGVSYKVGDQVEVTYQTDETNEDKLLVEYVRSF